MTCVIICGTIIGIVIICAIIRLIWEIPNPNSDINRSFRHEEMCPFCNTHLGQTVKFNIWILKEDCYHCDLCDRDISKALWNDFNGR